MPETWEICRVYTMPRRMAVALAIVCWLWPSSMRGTPAPSDWFCGVTRGSTELIASTRSTATSAKARSACCTIYPNSLEFGYAKPVAGIEVLDAAAAATAERRLAEILCACVDAGASVSYLPPLATDIARGFWKRASADVAAGTRILLAAWQDAILVGTVMLEFASAPNQPHRAEVQKLLVDPAARRRGVARALMLRLEQEAQRAGKTLLTLDTRAGDAAERLYRDMGWHEAGRIPAFALNADRTPCDTVFFWKQAPAQARPAPARDNLRPPQRRSVRDRQARCRCSAQ